jgi:hypothetical protein
MTQALPTHKIHGGAVEPGLEEVLELAGRVMAPFLQIGEGKGPLKIGSDPVDEIIQCDRLTSDRPLPALRLVSNTKPSQVFQYKQSVYLIIQAQATGQGWVF